MQRPLQGSWHTDAGSTFSAVYINGATDIQGTNNIGNNNNGSVLFGGEGSYTGVYNFDNISLANQSIGLNYQMNYVDFETGDLTQAAANGFSFQAYLHAN